MSEHLYLKGHPKAGAFHFVVEPFTEDYTGRLSWRNLGNQMLRCADMHAGSHGFGYEYTQRTRHAWVLSRLVVEMQEMPRTGEAYSIETWVNSIYRQFTDRLFAITAPDGRVYGYGCSTWALIDMDSRQPMNLDELPNGGFQNAIIPQSVPIEGLRRIRLKNAETVREVQAKYSDLDINGHVNSVRYIEMMLDLFPKSRYDETPARRIEVAYSLESYYDDVLTFVREDVSEQEALVEIRKNGAQPIVKATISFG